MGQEINVDAVIVEWGAYYTDEGQSQKDLLLKVFQESETLSIFRRIPFRGDIMKKGLIESTEMLQQYNGCNFTPKGGVTMVPHSIVKKDWTIDFVICPKEQLHNWAGFLQDHRLSIEDMPYVKYLVENVFPNQIIEDIEENIFGAEYVEHPVYTTPGTPGNASESMNGISFFVNDYVTKGFTAPVATGALDPDDSVFVKQVEDWFKSLPKKISKKIKTIYMSYSNAERYATGYEELYNIGQNDLKNGPVYDAGALRYRRDVRIMGLTSFEDNPNAILATTPGNLIFLTDFDQNLGQFSIDKYEVKKIAGTSSGAWGFGAEDPRNLFINDQW